MTHIYQLTLPYFTNIPKDVITNVWHFDWVGGGGPGASDYLALKGHVYNFYANVFTSATLAAWAPWVNLAGAKTKIYAQADPIPRVPVYQLTATMGGTQASSSTIPPEVAIAVSYQADPLSGVPQARRRGRIFIGGIGVGVTAGTTTTFPVPTPTLLSNVSTAAASLEIASAATGWNWIVWSRTNGSASTVTNGWVDNAFDTQRRRGQAASARSLWT